MTTGKMTRLSIVCVIICHYYITACHQDNMLACSVHVTMTQIHIVVTLVFNIHGNNCGHVGMSGNLTTLFLSSLRSTNC